MRVRERLLAARLHPSHAIAACSSRWLLLLEARPAALQLRPDDPAHAAGPEGSNTVQILAQVSGAAMLLHPGHALSMTSKWRDPVPDQSPAPGLSEERMQMAQGSDPPAQRTSLCSLAEPLLLLPCGCAHRLPEQMQLCGSTNAALVQAAAELCALPAAG
jgi:hypothetical protein